MYLHESLKGQRSSINDPFEIAYLLLELISLVQHDAGSDWEIKKKARTLREEVVTELSPALVAQAEVWGRTLDLWKTAEALLSEEADT